MVKALSIRQPWAWAIVHAGKAIENRDWNRYHPGRRFRGTFYVHASKGMTQAEYLDARAFMASIGVDCPPAHELIRGAVIGTAKVIGFATESTNKWWMGPGGLVVTEAKPCNPIAADGKLGFFEWSPAHREPEKPLPWMLKAAPDYGFGAKGALL